MSEMVKQSGQDKPAPAEDAGSGVQSKVTKPRRFTLEELLAGMTPERSEFMDDDWPVGEELI